MNYRDLYTTVLLRRQRLLDACKGLPNSILTRNDYSSTNSNLLMQDSRMLSLLDVLNEIFRGEDHWLRVALEREPRVFPDSGFKSVEEIETAIRQHQGGLLTLTGMGPDGGWKQQFALPDAPTVSYPATVIFEQFLCNEWRWWGVAQYLLQMNGLEPPILDLI